MEQLGRVRLQLVHPATPALLAALSPPDRRAGLLLFGLWQSGLRPRLVEFALADELGNRQLVEPGPAGAVLPRLRLRLQPRLQLQRLHDRLELCGDRAAGHHHVRRTADHRAGSAAAGRPGGQWVSPGAGRSRAGPPATDWSRRRARPSGSSRAVDPGTAEWSRRARDPRSARAGHPSRRAA